MLTPIRCIKYNGKQSLEDLAKYLKSSSRKLSNGFYCALCQSLVFKSITRCKHLLSDATSDKNITKNISKFTSESKMFDNLRRQCEKFAKNCRRFDLNQISCIIWNRTKLAT